MVILRTRNKITDFFMILAWASPFKYMNGYQEKNVALLKPNVLPSSCLICLGTHTKKHDGAGEFVDIAPEVGLVGQVLA